MSALKYWVWLAEVPGLTHANRWQLLAHFHSPEEIYCADRQQLLLCPGITEAQADLLDKRDLDQAEEILSRCAQKDIFIVTAQDAAYPHRLREIYDAPLLLYGKGSMPLFDEEAAIAVVGTRHNTPYGLQCAGKLGYQLARQGAVVVSGLAHGIDAAAHEGALRAGGFVAGVLGCGVDVVYPASSRRLYEDVAAAGVLLSEYPPGIRPLGWHFPARNRIISGLSIAAVVVEAPRGSGALITADLALQQGRDVFAVPGPIDAPESWGCNRLIRDGAGLAAEAWDILEPYCGRFPHRLHRNSSPVPHKPFAQPQEEEPAAVVEEEVLPQVQRADLSPDQQCLLQALEREGGKLADELAEETELSIRQVLSALTLLEIDGYVRQEGPGRFVRTVEIIDGKKEG